MSATILPRSEISPDDADSNALSLDSTNGRAETIARSKDDSLLNVVAPQTTEML